MRARARSGCSAVVHNEVYHNPTDEDIVRAAKIANADFFISHLPEGYDTMRCYDMLNEWKDLITAVRGNCDAEIDQAVLAFPIMADYALLCEGGRTVFATHGHLYNPDCLPPLHAGEILLSGHTHVPLCTERSGIVCLNPGSAAIPKEGSPHSYLMLENGVFTWKTIDDTVYGTLILFDDFKHLILRGITSYQQ